jgi:hypothetical protein
MTFINELLTLLTPLALRAALLMTLSFKMKSISKNYEFNINMMEQLFSSLKDQAKPITNQEFSLKKGQNAKEADEYSSSSLLSSGSLDENDKKKIEDLLPKPPSLGDLETKEILVYSNVDYENLTKYLTNSFLNSIIVSILPEHRLYLLTLICFYIKSEEKSDFTDLELEFLMRGKYNSNINISLSDFGVPEKTPIPKWIPKDNWNDLLAMSLLQGELDHFAIAIVSAEKEWREWYESPFKNPFPKIEMEVDKNSNFFLLT